MRSAFRSRKMRAAQLIVALSLALPASALALARSTGAEARSARAGGARAGTLPVHLLAHRLRYGQSVTLGGSGLVAYAGQTVVLQSARGGRWRTLSSARVGSRGRFDLRARLEHSAQLRAVELAGGLRRLPRASGLRGGVASPIHATVMDAVSRVERVEVAARLRVARRERSAVVGGRLTVAGQLDPARAGRRVLLRARGAHGWQTVAVARTGERGGFGLRWMPNATIGARRLRVDFAGDRLNVGSDVDAGPARWFSATVASWYVDTGSNACGFRAGYGVANKTLPCGTKVTFRHGGRTVTATVDDRGPYVGGRDYDLDQDTAAALGFAGVGTVYASIG